MEKFSFKTTEIPKDNKIPAESKGKNSGLSTWVKTAVLSVGILGSQSAISQENKEMDSGKDALKKELYNDISTFYKKAYEKDEKNFKFFDYSNFSDEDKSTIKKEKESEILSFKEAAENPKQFYESLLKTVEEVRSGIIVHFCSQEFLDRLLLTENHEEAKKKQTDLVENLVSVKISFANPDTIAAKSASGHGLAYYLPESHEIVVPYFNLSKHAIAHELIHSAYRGDKLLTERERKLFRKSFKRGKEMYKQDNKYLHNVPERLARKIKTDLFLEDLGIKKYGEEFTKEHYKKIEELKQKNQLDGEVLDLFDTSSEEGFIQIMNIIASEDTYENKDLNQNLS